MNRTLKPGDRVRLMSAYPAYPAGLMATFVRYSWDSVVVRPDGAELESHWEADRVEFFPPSGHLIVTAAEFLYGDIDIEGMGGVIEDLGEVFRGKRFVKWTNIEYPLIYDCSVGHGIERPLSDAELARPVTLKAATIALYAACPIDEGADDALADVIHSCRAAL